MPNAVRDCVPVCVQRDVRACVLAYVQPCVRACVQRFVSAFVFTTVFLDSIGEVYFIFKLSRSALPLWCDLTSQLSILHWLDKRGNGTEERGTKRHEGPFLFQPSERALSDVSLAGQTSTSSLISYRVPEEGCAAGNCKSFCPRTECAARVPLDEGENLCRASRQSVRPVRPALGRSDSKPTVRQSGDREKLDSTVGTAPKSEPGADWNRRECPSIHRLITTAHRLSHYLGRQ